MKNKYYLKCFDCGYETPDFSTWFEQNQSCPKCGSKRSEVWYNSDYNELQYILKSNPESFWQYFYYLPLNKRENIITRNEGAVPIQRWWFLEDFAREKYNLNIEVLVYRNDLNGGTGTFKDVSAALAASIFKENDIKQYCVASTGNTATAYARYLAIAGVNCSTFIPQDALKASESIISAFGQQVFRVNGDYTKAKQVAAEYSKKYNILMSTGNIDPIRVEAKKTMVFEWLRQIEKIPDVYIQAVSGGTGPIAIDKGIREINSIYPKLKNPRFILIQPDKCDPMVKAWEEAEKGGFPTGFEKNYPIIDCPNTKIPTLATGNPVTYPIIAKLTKESGGTFLRMKESKLADYGKLVAFERKLIIGPASAVAFAGFFEALKNNKINDGESVMINLGESFIRAPEFLQEIIGLTKIVNSVDECQPHLIDNYSKIVWKNILED